MDNWQDKVVERLNDMHRKYIESPMGQRQELDRELEDLEEQLGLMELRIRNEQLKARHKLMEQRLKALNEFTKSIDGVDYDYQLSYLDILTIAGNDPLVLASRYIPHHIAQEVWDRDGGRCVICGSASELQFDHIIPHSKGGATSVENLQLLCKTHNQSKGANL